MKSSHLKRSQLKTLVKTILKEVLSQETVGEIRNPDSSEGSLKLPDKEIIKGFPVADLRRTAGEYHGGQWTAFYAFASTGTVLNGIAREAKICLKDADPDDLQKLNAIQSLEDMVNPNPLEEMSSTGAVVGYSTPFAFTKNKKGSPKGIAAAKKYGKVVGEAPRV